MASEPVHGVDAIDLGLKSYCPVESSTLLKFSHNVDFF